jgi:hypothetical protein
VNVLLAGAAIEMVIALERLLTTVTSEMLGVSVGGTSVGGGGSVGDGITVGASVGGGGRVGASVGGGRVGASVGGGGWVGNGVGVGSATTACVSWQDSSVKHASPIRQNQTVKREVVFMDHFLPVERLSARMDELARMKTMIHSIARFRTKSIVFIKLRLIFTQSPAKTGVTE